VVWRFPGRWHHCRARPARIASAGIPSGSLGALAQPSASRTTVTPFRCGTWPRRGAGPVEVACGKHRAGRRATCDLQGRPLARLMPRAPLRSGRQPVRVPRGHLAAIRGPSGQPARRDQGDGEGADGDLFGQVSPGYQLDASERGIGQLADPVDPHRHGAARGRAERGDKMPVRTCPSGARQRASTARGMTPAVG